jgi:hypothetical protein
LSYTFTEGSFDSQKWKEKKIKNQKHLWGKVGPSYSVSPWMKESITEGSQSITQGGLEKTSKDACFLTGGSCVPLNQS